MNGLQKLLQRLIEFLWLVDEYGVALSSAMNFAPLMLAAICFCAPAAAMIPRRSAARASYFSTVHFF
jgi:hypothetical protein